MVSGYSMESARQPSQLAGDGDADGTGETEMKVTFSILSRRAFCTFA
jgi:hypothetical protein